MPIAFLRKHECVELSRILPEAAEGDVPDVLTIDQYLARGRFVEPEQHLGDGGLASPRVADNGDCFPLLHRQRKVLEDFQGSNVTFVRMADVFKLYFARFYDQILGPWFVVNFGLVLHEVQELLQVDHARLSFPVHGPYEVERYGELEEEGIDEDEASEVCRAFRNALERQPHREEEPGVEDGVLAKVEQCE
ncbi:multidrug ABC transporter ATP-binding protein, putative [Babesia ovata]|uniref:Multidrug ABC transporter ATP-binding protein, putative n=1 Tax=Babesia ovata TaxID=189622 RepID=A0A2H6K859_9APIC|nr:multidrug ABC transporter ATP-binding protein, putative [Babesia ovata]GBE59139.1 multidrug ABC transporter ATP-binding protein, putative [Babesia ovata]